MPLLLLLPMALRPLALRLLLLLVRPSRASKTLHSSHVCRFLAASAIAAGDGREGWRGSGPTMTAAGEWWRWGAPLLTRPLGLWAPLVLGESGG